MRPSSIHILMRMVPLGPSACRIFCEELQDCTDAIIQLNFWCLVVTLLFVIELVSAIQQSSFRWELYSWTTQAMLLGRIPVSSNIQSMFRKEHYLEGIALLCFSFANLFPRTCILNVLYISVVLFYFLTWKS